MNYREDGVTPYVVFWKDGLKEQKLVRPRLLLFPFPSPVLRLRLFSRY
jgi:hypothetical protein